MDAQFVLALSRLSRGPWRTWRIQREVYVQSIRPARRVLRHLAITYPRHLSQFLSTGETLAVHRDSAGPRRHMNGRAGQIAVLDFAPANTEFCEQVIDGLSQQP